MKIVAIFLAHILIIALLCLGIWKWSHGGSPALLIGIVLGYIGLFTKYGCATH